MNPQPIDLTFFCELDAPALEELFANPEVIPFLKDLRATVSLGIVDLSEQRAGIARRLNEAGVPVAAWLLLPRQEGYWFNLDNHAQAAARYDRFKEWTQANGLHWARVGLDIEPDLRASQLMATNRLAGLQQFGRNLFDIQRLRRGRRAYHALAAQIHADGYEIETYQIPFVVDERMVQSSLLQRAAGLVDLPEADHEALMLYSSFIRPWGQGVLWSYAQQADGIGVGITGKGMEVELAQDIRPMSWAELETDLLLAHRRCQRLYIFSLEGCVRQNFLAQLREMDWQKEVKIPILYADRVDGYRQAGRRVLWALARPAWVLFGLALGVSLGALLTRKNRG